MNILPKKSWHVRTKQNIARVRRDEAKAAEEEKETQRRIALAAQEARTALLRERASKRLNAETAACRDVDLEGDEDINVDGEGDKEEDLRFGIALGSLKDVVQPDGHVNFFQDVEAGKRQGGKTNEEYEEEKKKEQDDYEKKIGYLVFLGQDSLEQTKEKPWYAKIDRGIQQPSELEKELETQRELDRAAAAIGGLEEKSKSMSVEEIKMAKFKSFIDPLKDIRKYLSTPGVKKKLDRIPSSTSSTKKLKSSDQSSSPSRPAKRKRLSTSLSESDKHKRKSKKEKKSKRKHKSSKKSKKHRHHRKRSRSSSSSKDSESDDDDDQVQKKKRENLEKLRQERLEREREERRRAEKVLAKLRGEEEPSSAKQLELDRRERSSSNRSYNNDMPSMASVKQKYNSQFNPHLARQNYD